MSTETTNKILQIFNIAALNEMQLAAHLAISKEKDVLLLAPTGSGKTLAYLLPILQLLKASGKNPQCLVLVPSRELALQIEQVWKKMATSFKVNACYGGHLMETEINNLSDPPALIVGTPGRVMDHITRGTINADTITTLVLDEFDKSLALGFEDEMSFIIRKLGHVSKRILVSATTAVEIPAFTGVTAPTVIDFVSEKSGEGTLEMKQVISPTKDKAETLFKLLSNIGGESTLVFCNHREAAERTHTLLAEMGIENAFFHGGLEQTEREQTLTRFRNGSVWFLIATDLAARGLDIPEVKHIVHYHLPSTKEEFIHRNGRTARQDATGTAYLLLHAQEPLPSWLSQAPEELKLRDDCPLPPAPHWTTVYISGGKKDKLNKIDIVGFFSKIGKLEKDDLGMILVKDFISYAAVKRNKVKQLLQLVQQEKMKGKKYKIAVAK
jgi:superfamily II DNA/RNA helicase